MTCVYECLEKWYDDGMKEDLIEEADAEKVMSMLVKKSGFERWVLGEHDSLMFKSSKARLGSYVLSWDDDSFAAVDVSMKKTGPASCRDVVEMLLEISRKGREIYTTSPEQDKVVTLMKPFQSLEELLIEVDLFFDAGDTLDDVG